MLRLKFLTSAILIPILLWFLYRGGLPLFLFSTAFMLMAMYEFYAALPARGVAPVRWAGWLACSRPPRRTARRRRCRPRAARTARCCAICATPIRVTSSR